MEPHDSRGRLDEAFRPPLLASVRAIPVNQGISEPSFRKLADRQVNPRATQTHTHTHTRARTHTHTHTHTLDDSSRSFIKPELQRGSCSSRRRAPRSPRSGPSCIHRRSQRWKGSRLHVPSSWRGTTSRSRLKIQETTGVRRSYGNETDFAEGEGGSKPPSKASKATRDMYPLTTFKLPDRPPLVPGSNSLLALVSVTLLELHHKRAV